MAFTVKFPGVSWVWPPKNKVLSLLSGSVDSPPSSFIVRPSLYSSISASCSDVSLLLLFLLFPTLLPGNGMTLNKDKKQKIKENHIHFWKLVINIGQRAKNKVGSRAKTVGFRPRVYL